MAKNIFIAVSFLAICVICSYSSPVFAASGVEIKSVYEYRNSEYYDIDSGGSVLFVREFPVFNGAGAKKMEAVFAQGNDEIGSAAKKFTRQKSKYSYEDYLSVLSKTEDQYFDIVTCSIEYDKNGVVSIVRVLDWYMGGVHDIIFDCHTFDVNTGRELEISDVLQGSQTSILATLKREFEAENGELMEAPSAPVGFYLSDEGVIYTPSEDIIFGFQRGAVLTIPFNRTDLIKAPFAVNR